MRIYILPQAAVKHNMNEYIYKHLIQGTQNYKMTIKDRTHLSKRNVKHLNIHIQKLCINMLKNYNTGKTAVPHVQIWMNHCDKLFYILFNKYNLLISHAAHMQPLSVQYLFLQVQNHPFFKSRQNEMFIVNTRFVKKNINHIKLVWINDN